MCESQSTSDPIDQLIVPAANAFETVNRASKIYVRQCPCRIQAQFCPPETWEVCLLFEDAETEDLQSAKPISREDAIHIMKTMAQRGMIYNLFFRRYRQTVTEICNCCTCCCRSLNRMKAVGDYQVQLRSGYVAVTDEIRCSVCGLCEASCFFGARTLEDGKLLQSDEKCFGCGKCMTVCPQKAITIEWQAGRGISIPMQVF